MKGFACYGPAGLCFNGSALRGLRNRLRGCNGGVILICNNNSVGGGKVCSSIIGVLRSRNGSMTRVTNIVPGPAVRGLHRNLSVTEGRNISLVLTINNNSIVSCTGTLTISMRYSRSP